MNKKIFRNGGRWRRAVSLACLIFGFSIGTAWSAKPLLDLPAPANLKASSSVLLSIARAGDRLVAAGEQGIVLLSDDSGANWRQAKVPAAVTLTNVRFFQNRRGWIVGHGGLVMSTDDAGETWVKRLDGGQAAQIELEAAKAADDGSGAARRRVVDAERLVADGADKPFLDVYFRDETHGLVVGAYGLAFATEDGGKTWRSIKSGIEKPTDKHLYAIHAEGADIWLAGEQGVLYRSRENMTSFSRQRSPYEGTYFGAMASSDGALIVFGLRGNAYRTVDGGASWKKTDTKLPVTLTGGKRLADGALLLVDESGRVLRSNDDGVSFKALSVPNPSAYTDVVQAPNGSLVLTGARGISRLFVESESKGNKA